MKQQAQETTYKTFAPPKEAQANFCRAAQHLINAIAKQPKEDFIKVTKSA